MEICKVQKVLNPPPCTRTTSPLFFTILVSLTLSVLCEIASKLLMALVAPEPAIQSPAAKIRAVLKKAKPPTADVWAICVDRFTKPVRLPCGHVFCKSCIRTALSQNDQCPLCRRNVFENPARQGAGLSMRRLKCKWKKFADLFGSGFAAGVLGGLVLVLILKFLVAILSPGRYYDMCCFGYNFIHNGLPEISSVLLGAAVYFGRSILRPDLRIPHQDLAMVMQGTIYGAMCVVLCIYVPTYHLAFKISFD